MQEGYSITLCICWKELLLNPVDLGPRFRTEAAAERYAESLKAGPALVAAISEAQGYLRRAINAVGEERHTDNLAAAYGVLNRALEGMKEAV